MKLDDVVQCPANMCHYPVRCLILYVLKQTLNLPFSISHLIKPRKYFSLKGPTHWLLGTHSLHKRRYFHVALLLTCQESPLGPSFHVALLLSLPYLALRSWIDRSNHRYSASISTTIVSPYCSSLHLKIDPFLRFFGAEIDQSEPVFLQLQTG